MTGESVEQAALRRARFEDRTLAILDRCVTAVEKLDQLDDKRAQEIDELRDSVAALSNRIEAATRDRLVKRGKATCEGCGADVYLSDRVLDLATREPHTCP